jgi:hypothetical protein
VTRQPARPVVPAGTILRLAAQEWSFSVAVPPGYPLAVVVVRIRYELADQHPDALWVIGHRPECAYPSVEQHQPCLELLVKVAALIRAVSADE